ncbi:MAG: hypothetical protein C0483_26150 [Pirellula sp.]|nr:hypothetical protein [Pirellula sp.]
MAIVASCTLVGLGAWLGARRFAMLASSAVVGSLVALFAGAAVGDLIAVVASADTLLTASAGYVLAYLGGFAGAALLTSKLLASRKSPRSAGGPSRGERLRGAALALLPAVALVWIVRGELPREGLLPSAVAAGGSSAPSDVLRPVAVVRACKMLCALDAGEAERVASRPEVRAVVESPALERLFRRPGLVHEFAAAADGDWRALTKLAVDPTVKAAMDDPEFLRRVQAVDLVALAKDVETERRGGALLSSSSSSLPAGAIAAVPLRLPAYAGEDELRRRVAAEWSGEDVAAELVTAEARIADPPTAAEQRARYWRQVEIGLGLLGAGARVLP